MDDSKWVLIDGGYLSFLRYHATKKYWSYRKEADQENPWVNEEEFRAVLLRNYEKVLKKLSKGKKAIFAMESLDGQNWRKSIHPNYKGTRPKNNDIFTYLKYITHEFLPQICENIGNITYCRLAGTEADDIIALKAIELLQLEQVSEISIISKDMDFLQLVEKDNKVRIYDANYKLNKKCEEELVGFSYLKYKLVNGDTSDNIMPIYKGKNCTKRKQQLLESLYRLNDLDLVSSDIFEDEESYQKFLFNRSLIDFRMILETTRSKFNELTF